MFFSQNPVLTLILISYPVFLVSFVTFLFISKISLKENGWFFIITMIVVLTAPFEMYLLSIDFKIFRFVNSGIFDVNDVIYLMIAKPFSKKSNEN